MLGSDRGGGATALLAKPAPEVATPRRDLLAGDPPSRRDILVAVLLGLAVVGIALVWRSPVIPTDPWHYIQRALTFPDRVWVPLGYTRYGIIVPNILPARIFGNAQAAFYFFPLVSAFVLAVVTYLLGRRWWGPVAGVVGVVVLFANSLVFHTLTRQYPDLQAMAIIMSAAFCALMARDRGFRGRAAVVCVLAAGFCLGWSFEVRETALFAWPLVLAILWRRGALLKVMGLAALPVLVWAAGDIAVGAVAYGDPLLKLHTFLGFGGTPPEEGTPAAIALDARTRGYYLEALPKGAFTRPDGWWMLVAGAVTIAALAVRNWPVRLIAASFTSVLALNLLAGGLLFPDRPFGDIFNTRYWVQYIPAMALVVGGLTGLLVAWAVARLPAGRSWPRVALAAALGVAVCAVPVVQTARWVPTVEAFAPNGGNALEELRAHLATTDIGEGEMWTDWETRRLLPVYMRPALGGEKVWSADTRSLTGAGEPKSGDTVLLYSDNGDTCNHCRVALEPWRAENPTLPTSWELIWSTPTGNARLYSVR